MTNPQTVSKNLKPNPYAVYRDPSTGRWLVINHNHHSGPALNDVKNNS